MKNLIQKISTHHAVKNANGKIDIYVTGFEIDDLKFQDELIYSNVEEDDVFAIFERFEEDNRINVGEFNEAI